VLHRAARLAIVILLGTGFIAVPARAERRLILPPAHIVLLTVDGTSIQDWLDARAFGALDSFGLLATRTGDPSRSQAQLRTSAYVSLGAGTPVSQKPGDRTTGRRGDAVLGLLGESLARIGAKSTAIGDASGDDVSDAPAGLAVMRLNGIASIDANLNADGRRAARDVTRVDRNSPGGRRTDFAALRRAVSGALGWARLVVVDLGDAERADRAFRDDQATRSRWVRRALSEASLFADELRRSLKPSDTLVVAALVPPLARVRAGVNLGAVGFSRYRGMPTSGTTRQKGVITLADLAPTLLDMLDADPPAEMQGRTARIEPELRRPLVVAAERDAAFDRALRSRRPLTRVWLLAAVVLSAIAFLTVIAGRGRAPGNPHIPRGWRDLIGIGLLAGAATPAAFLIAPAAAGSGHSVATVSSWTAGIAVAGAVAARAIFGHQRGLAVLALFTALLYGGDLLAGSPLASRSAIGFQVAGGGRFYGVDEGMLGVLLAAPLVAAGVLTDRAHLRGRMLRIVAAGLAAVAVLAGAPAFGSKFGAPFTLVPAFGVFLVLAAGRRFTRRHAIGVAIATILLSGTLAAIDALGAPEARSHIGREIAGQTSVTSLVGRKATSLVKITATTVWLPATVLIGASVLLILLRRRDLFARAMWGRPAARAAMASALVGCVFAMGANDTGIITVAAAVPFLAASFYGALLAPEQGGL
jgi:hypothetical protein